MSTEIESTQLKQQKTTADHRPPTADERPPTDDGRPPTGDGRPGTDGGQGTRDKGQRTKDKGQETRDDQSPIPTLQSPHRLILLAFISLAVIYSLVTPPFEAGDESRHYAVVKYMAATGRLIVQNGPETGRLQHHWSHEGNQPPLYYALAAGLTAWIDGGDWDDVFWYNPHAGIGDPLRPDNKNITIHPPNETWQGYALAARVIRFMSIAMAAVTVLAAYAIALHLFRGNRWLAAGAMAITAFNPMFIFISASVNNDNAVIMFVTLALWLMVKSSARLEAWPAGRFPLATSSEQALPLHLPALLGLLIGLGALSKLYALGLLPLAGLLLLGWAYQTAHIQSSPLQLHPGQTVTRHSSLVTRQFWRAALLWNGVMLAVFLAVAGWFYLRNALLYDGDLFALQVMRETAGQRRQAPSLATLWAEFEGFRIAYWALFGGVNILVASWIYKLLDAVSLVAALGVVAYALRFTIYDLRFTIYDLRFTTFTKTRRSAIRNTQYAIRNTHHASRITFLILLCWYSIMLAGFILWNLTQPAGQGRLMYPAIAAISALGMLGLTWWLPSSLRPWLVIACSLSLFIFALLSPFRAIAPAYAKPPLLTEAQAPAEAQPVNFIYDGKLRLIGYQLQADVVRPAQTLPITLYWEILEATPLDYSIFIHLLGRQRQVIGQIDTYPGGGAWPTTLLQAGDVIADHYDVPINPQAELEHAPSRLQIVAGIYDYGEAGRPGKAALNQAGQPVEPIIASAKLIPWQWPDPPRLETTIDFSGKASLLSYELAADSSSLTLNWAASQPFAADYTVFIQVWRANPPEYVAGFDGPPVQNDYPTSLWAPGEIIVDHHPLDLSQLDAGSYNLLVGLYNPASGERLPASGPGGPLPDSALTIGPFHIEGNQE